MKKVLFLLALSFQFSLQAQTISPVPDDKAVVYFARTSMLGALVKFTYFDENKVIGQFNGSKYLRYECEPGEHVFWAKSENKDFVTANLEAGKIYVIHVQPKMGFLKSGVRLHPVNSSAYKMKRIEKLLSKRHSASLNDKKLAQLQKRKEGVITRGLEKYESLGEEVKRLNGISFSPEELM